jgi:hypothetical protein
VERSLWRHRTFASHQFQAATFGGAVPCDPSTDDFSIHHIKVAPSVPRRERHPNERRVSTMCFDPQIQDWRFYDGSVARQLREKRREADTALRSAA